MRDVPGFSRFGLGAVACGGVTVFNGEPLAELRLTEDALDPVRERALAGLERRERSHAQGDASAEVAGGTVVIVDDGVETNAKLHAAALATRCRARHGMDRIDP